MPNSLNLACHQAESLEPHLPPKRGKSISLDEGSSPGQASSGKSPVASAPSRIGQSQVGPRRPFVTLSFAMSLDSSLALTPGQRFALSGPESKAMTHYLRSRHDAICIGVGTAVADDPGLNCRIRDATLAEQPRPFVIDPHARWHPHFDSRVLQTARAGLGLAPYIITAVRDPPAATRELLEKHGGKYIVLTSTETSSDADGKLRLTWPGILAAMHAEGLQSVMIEGGAGVINTLLEPASQHLVDSVILTIAPTWLGQGGVVVSPARTHDECGNAVPAARLTDVSWYPFGADMVLCGKING